MGEQIKQRGILLYLICEPTPTLYDLVTGADTFIGDGGGCIIHSSGDVKYFLHPQKANTSMPNLLAASLGPIIEGQPVTGTIERPKNSLLIVGTDGIFDRVDETFPRDVLRGVIRYKGNLQATAEHILKELSESKDSIGYLCDDNMTIGLMGDGNQPVLPLGFWSCNATEHERTLHKVVYFEKEKASDC